MRAFQLLANQPAPETLPSATARTSLLVAVGRHEDRLHTLRRQIHGALWRGEVEADEALQSAAYELEAGLSAMHRAVAAELDEIIAVCEDGLATATTAAANSPDGGASALEETVANARHQLRELPSMLNEASHRCSAAAIASLRGASKAAERAIGDGASRLTRTPEQARTAAAARRVLHTPFLRTQGRWPSPLPAMIRTTFAGARCGRASMSYATAAYSAV